MECTPLLSAADDINCIKLKISGMTCAMCSRLISNALLELPGITDVNISLTTDTAYIKYKKSGLLGGINEIMDCIDEIGYEIENVEGQNDIERGDLVIKNKPTENRNGYPNKSKNTRLNSKRGVEKLKKSFLLSLLGTLPIFIITMILSKISWSPVNLLLNNEILPGFTVESFLLWILCTPVQFGCGWIFYRGAYDGLKHNALGMDVLIALGTTASYAYAVMVVLTNMIHLENKTGSHFFETSAMLISFMLLGKWMQLLATNRTSNALRELINLQSPLALRVTSSTNMKSGDDKNIGEQSAFNVHAYDEEEISIEAVRKGDILKLVRGASIPADGQIHFGSVTVDQAMMTGESLPVLKSIDCKVIGGTIVSEGLAFMRVTGVGSETALSQIVKLMEEAQMSRAPIEEFADRIAAKFVKIVCSVALSVFFSWYGLCLVGVVPSSWYEGQTKIAFSIMFAIATLVISCPCSLGLATPTAIMVGTGVGAKIGILIKGGQQLQKASEITAVVFDKTGTLTKGQPIVTDIIRLCDTEEITTLTDQNLFWLLASLERNSEHPLASAIVKHAEAYLSTKKNAIPLAQPTEFQAVTGQGVSGNINGTPLAVGNRSFIMSRTIFLSTEAENILQPLEREGKTALIAAVHNKVIAIIGLADEIKPDAAATVYELVNRQHLQVYMATGDNRRTAVSVARKLGIPPENVLYEALPEDKFAKVKYLQLQEHVVAMVGDGINDAPALAQSDVGISIGAGMEIATEAADIVLTKNGVWEVCVALNLAKTIMRRIRINFFWAFFYNSVGIPIAAGIFFPFWNVRLPPTVAGIAMSLSSLSVVASSMLLKFYLPPKIS